MVMAAFLKSISLRIAILANGLALAACGGGMNRPGFGGGPNS